MKYAINYQGRPRRGHTYRTADEAQEIIDWSLSAERLTKDLLGRPLTVFWLERKRPFSRRWEQLPTSSETS